jgi:energy-converting hydrogenase A subunit O
MLPTGLIRAGGTCTRGEGTHVGEAPRGELSYHIISDSYGRIKEISIQTPSIMNIEVCAHHMVVGVTSIADVMATYISADPCISCTER